MFHFHLCCMIRSFLEPLLVLFQITMSLLLTVVVLAFILLLMTAPIYWIIKRMLNFRHKIQHTNVATQKLDVSIGFFHPYCNAGGGGERVLWCAVKAIQEKYPHVRCIVYTGDTDATESEILEKAKQRFNITFDQPIEFIFLHWRKLVEPYLYPHFTLLGQSVGSMILALEALFKFIPTVYLDTMGYAFTIPIFKYLGSCQVGCYVHYPTISDEMSKLVANRSESHNNAGSVAKNVIFSQIKLIYYQIFAYIYGLVGKRSQVVMVNSSWTKNHILNLWRLPEITHCIYPPCDVTALEKLPMESKAGKIVRNIVSVSQFRPEKDHTLQIQAFNEFLMSVNEKERFMYKLILIGSCRNTEDENRVQKLRDLSRELNIAEYVEFKLNLSFEDLKGELERATIGLHTMWNEHFGIGVVECMAAGLVVLAHDSGGPQMDIVVEHDGIPTGFLAKDVSSYAMQMSRIFEMDSEELLKIRRNARMSVKRFSEREFVCGFLECVKLLFVNIPM